MKTTLDLPDDLMRAIKIHAVKENRNLKYAVADLLKRGLSRERMGPATVRQRVKLPLIRCAHPRTSGAPAGYAVSSPSIVGMSSETVGWMGTARWSTS